MYFILCAFDEVICVRGTEISGYMDDDKYYVNKDFYFIDEISNFCKEINFFASYFYRWSNLLMKNMKCSMKRGYGTSGSSLLIAMVAASII